MALESAEGQTISGAHDRFARRSPRLDSAIYNRPPVAPTLALEVRRSKRKSQVNRQHADITFISAM
jgi:hypothetical protein